MNQPPENYPQTPQNLEDIPNLRLLNYAQLLPAPWGGWHTHTTPHTPVLNWFQQWGYLPLPTAHPYGLPNLPQRPPTQIDPNIASIISGAFQAALTTMQQQGTNNTTGGLQTGGKSTKILQGTNRYSLLGLCSLTIQDDVPKIIRIFDSNKDTTAKFQALKDLLLMAQNSNAFVNFTLQKETFKDLKQHQFHFDHDEKNTTCGFSPFCLQKMDKGSKIALCQLEEHMEQVTYTSVNDLTKCNQSLKFAPITEPLAFLTAIANTHALAWALFTNLSPIMQGLQELQLLMLHHLHKG